VVQYCTECDKGGSKLSKEQGSESAVSGSQFIKKEEEMAEEKEAPKRVSRRQFVKGAAVGGAGVAAAGMLASCAPAPVPTTAPGETAAPCPTCLPAGECPPPVWLPEKWDDEADIVVVGYGGAGASAAIAGTDAGAEMLLIEVAPEEFIGGNTICSGGGWTHAYDKDKYLIYLRKLCRGATPDQYLADWAEVETQIIAWMEYLGIGYQQAIHDYGHFFTTEMAEVRPGVSAGAGVSKDSGIDQYRAMDADGNLVRGAGLFKLFADRVAERNVRVMYETRATELVQDGVTKEILGVKAEDKTGKEMYLKARKGVILACGGYENSPYLIDSNVTPGVRVYPAGTPYALGDGIYMSQKVGADIFHMAGIEWRGFGVKPIEGDNTFTINVQDFGSGIVVNSYGKRFYNEDKKLGHTKTYAALEFDGYPDDPTALSDYKGIPAFIIFDEAKRLEGTLVPKGYEWLWTMELYAWSEDNMKEIDSGVIKKADTIKELAEMSGIDPAALEETVNKWNGYCAAGEDLQFGRAPDIMLPIEVPPYYAIEVSPQFINTQGGPKHSNIDGRVLDRASNPIPRLYAAGECGSVYSLMYHGSGNVAEALIVGKIAAENAAADEPWA